MTAARSRQEAEIDAPELAARAAAAVAQCPGVVRLSDGPLGTYLAGHTVPGIAIREDSLSVAVVAAYGQPLPQLAARVREAVSAVAPGWRVDVTVEDIELPASGEPASGTGGNHG